MSLLMITRIFSFSKRIFKFEFRFQDRQLYDIAFRDTLKQKYAGSVMYDIAKREDYRRTEKLSIEQFLFNILLLPYPGKI